jgi:hypothetical protein
MNMYDFAEGSTAICRIGLVVGVAKYQEQKSLDNPVNDAQLFQKTLEARSFSVVKPLGGDKLGIEQAISTFEASIKQAGTSGAPVFKVAYFAGHGVEVAGAAYFLPSDFPSRVSTGALRFAGISLQSIVEAMSACAGPSLIVLDMCRGAIETSLPTDLSALSELVRDNREMYKKATEAHDLLIAYSTSAGDEAGDGPDGNSIYTRALCKFMLHYDMHVPEVFSEATASVITQTAARQRPWHYTSLSKGIRFSDLPRAKLTASTIFAHPASRISRLCPLQDSVLYYQESQVLMFRGLESQLVAKVPDHVEGLAATAHCILIADASGTLHWKDKTGIRPIGNHGVTHAAGLEISPSGCRVAAFGLESFSVMDLSETGSLSIKVPAKKQLSSFYGATWIDDDRLVLCGSHGTLTAVIFSARGHKVHKVQLEHHLPMYDAEVLSRYDLLAVSAAAGRIDFLDLATLTPRSSCDLSTVAMSNADTYSHLREAGLSRVEALEYLDNPDAVLSKYSDPDESQALIEALPTRHLLCLSQTSDS